ncbi:MAG TPA: CHAT domain-containing protein [Gemmatimonadaceae bacterium]|nr:CHAT domain-containing protein [Gemmatimonadaceae bacterium]
MKGRVSLSARLCASLVLVVACRAARDDASGASQLERALLRDRLMAAALAGEAKWHPCDTTNGSASITRERCGQAPAARAKSLKRINVTVRGARTWLESDSTPRALHADGLIALQSLETNPRSIDRAVEALERASLLAPTNAGFLNDLAAGYVALAERDQQLLPMLEALDAIERAMACDSTVAAVLFNRALILERLYLLKDAERAWERYTAVERREEWRSEGEARLRLVRARLAVDARPEAIDSLAARDDSSARRELRTRIERWPEGARDASFTLLRRWGSAVQTGDSAGAADALHRVRAIAEVLGTMNADQTVMLAVRAIETHQQDGHRLAALARAHVDFKDGLDLQFQAAQDDAVTVLARAQPPLEEAGSPLAQWAELYRGAAEIFRGHYAIADRLLDHVKRTTGPEQPAVVGKALWLLGVSQLLRGTYDVANQRYREARPFFERASEPENLGAISYLLAEGLQFSGQVPAGQSEALLGLRLLSPFRWSSHLNNHLTTVASYARADGLSHAALAIMDEALDVAQTLDRPRLIALARVARADDLIALRHLDAARAEFDEALRWVDRMDEGAGRDRTLADVLLVRGEIERAEDPRAALATLAHVASIYRGLKTDGHLAGALYQEAVAARAAGDGAGARARLQEAIDAIERQSAAFATPETRALLYETVERVFDATIRVELANNRPDSAFAYLERGRVAAWAPDTRLGLGQGRSPPSLTRIRRLLPADAVFVEYALLPDTLAMWIVSSRASRSYAVGVRRDSVARLVDRFTREMGDPDVTRASARTRLFDLLVAPFASELARGGELIVVPDRELARVPFAALWNHGTGRYVLEDFRVRTLPSAAFLLAASRTSRRDSRSSALVVGNPKLDAALAAELPPLPGAFREAEQVARRYERPQLLTGAEASRDRVVELLPKYGVFHFAGHAVANGDQPELSYLALGSQRSDEDGTLHAGEIAKLRLSNLRIVVLSACSTLNPRRSRMGAIAGLAYSFLRAGAPATVSTLWDVDDNVTTDLLVSFHKGFSAGLPAAEALRFAQQEALRSSRPELRSPKAWAAFVYTGP